jgi:predicted Ser/Thr protein kinase
MIGEMSPGPSTIGRYKILRTLGSGAMGTVYLAEDPLLKRPLAIKVVREGSGDAEVLERFKQEAEVSARLNHPNAVTVFDVGEEPELGPFLAMEYVEGERLSDRILRGPIAPAEAVGFLLQAAEALVAVHALGFIHRDIKPGNFMVGRDGRIKLMDFGIVRNESSRLTTTSTFLGSPAYAAPEALNGAGVTMASDQWSFAMTAYEMLTGDLPFLGDSVGATLYRIIHGEPVFLEELPGEMKEVFRRAFDKDPSRRHPDLRAFLQDLIQALPLEPALKHGCLARIERLGTERPLGVMPFGPPFSKGRWMRSPILWGGAVLALGLFGWAAFFRRDPSRVLSIDSRPGAAQVFLDGTPLGLTPLRQVVVKGRAERLRLEKPDYQTLEVRIQPEDSDLILRLQPAPFEVVVHSDPAGAAVSLDSEAKGRTPMSLMVPGTGNHQLRLTLEGRLPWSAIPMRHQPLPDPVKLLKAGTRKPHTKPVPSVKVPNEIVHREIRP